ncbi:hypothetical protein WA158_005400 [Blastocystis sp. Blastoise]
MPKRPIGGSNRPKSKRNQSTKKVEKEDYNWEISSDDESAISDNEAANIENSEESSEEEVQETVEEAKLRMAKEYLAKIKQEEGSNKAGSDEEGDDDEDSDDLDNLVEKRLEQDVQEKRGNVFTTYADKLDSTSFGKSSFYTGHHLSPTCICLSPDEHYVYTGSKDCDIIQWDIETGKKVTYFKGCRETRGNTEELKNFKGHHGDVYSVDIAFDGNLLASGGKDQYIRIFDVREGGKQKEEFKGHKGSIYTVKFKPNSYTLYSGGEDRVIKSWNLTDNAYIETLFGHQSAVMGLDCLREDKVVSVGFDNTLRLWKIIDETQLIYRGMTTMLSQEAVTCLGPNSFVSGSQKGDICLWNTMKKKPINILPNVFGDSRWTVSIASIYNSDLFAIGSYASGLKVYTVSKNKRDINLLHSIDYDGFMNGLCISPQGRFIVAAVGQEHRFGRWWRDGDAKNGILVQPITLKKE